jgi:hypothetical protein
MPWSHFCPPHNIHLFTVLIVFLGAKRELALTVKDKKPVAARTHTTSNRTPLDKITVLSKRVRFSASCAVKGSFATLYLRVCLLSRARSDVKRRTFSQQ